MLTDCERFSPNFCSDHVRAALSRREGHGPSETDASIFPGVVTSHDCHLAGWWLSSTAKPLGRGKNNLFLSLLASLGFFFNSLKVFEPRVMECGVVIVARTVAIGLGMVNDVVTHFFLRQKISSLLKSNSTFIDYIIWNRIGKVHWFKKATLFENVLFPKHDVAYALFCVQQQVLIYVMELFFVYFWESFPAWERFELKLRKLPAWKKSKVEFSWAFSSVHPGQRDPKDPWHWRCPSTANEKLGDDVDSQQRCHKHSSLPWCFPYLEGHFFVVSLPVELSPDLSACRRSWRMRGFRTRIVRRLPGNRNAIKALWRIPQGCAANRNINMLRPKYSWASELLIQGFT